MESTYSFATTVERAGGRRLLSETLPECSVIIPTYRRPSQLRSCLRALAALEYPPDRFEVVVVDDGGGGPLHEVAAESGVRIVRVIEQSNRGPAAARNTGARHAGGTLLAFTDDDCVPTVGWLAALARQFLATPDGVLGGRVVNGLPDNRFAQASQLILDLACHEDGVEGRVPRFFGTANMALASSLFETVGGFDADFRTAEDREFCDRCRFQGVSLVDAEEAVVFHVHDLSFVEFCRQHFHYGRGAHRYQAIRAARGSGTMSADIARQLAVLRWLLSRFRRSHWRQSAQVAGALLLWQVTNTAGYVAAAMQQRTYGRT